MKNDRHNPPPAVYTHGAAGVIATMSLLDALTGRRRSLPAPASQSNSPKADRAAANRIAKRRRRNRLAKASRKINRR